MNTMQDFDNLGDRVIEHLEQWKAQVNKVIDDLSNVEDKAKQIGLVNEIDTAVCQLKLCRENNILGKTKVVTLPYDHDYIYTGSCSYRIICDHESDNNDQWEEIKINGQFYRLGPGSKIIW